MQRSLKSTIKESLPGVLLLYRMFKHKNMSDNISALRFLAAPTLMASLPERWASTASGFYAANLGYSVRILRMKCYKLPRQY